MQIMSFPFDHQTAFIKDFQSNDISVRLVILNLVSTLYYIYEIKSCSFQTCPASFESFFAVILKSLSTALSGSMSLPTNSRKGRFKSPETLIVLFDQVIVIVWTGTASRCAFPVSRWLSRISHFWTVIVGVSRSTIMINSNLDSRAYRLSNHLPSAKRQRPRSLGQSNLKNNLRFPPYSPKQQVSTNLSGLFLHCPITQT